MDNNQGAQAQAPPGQQPQGGSNAAAGVPGNVITDFNNRLDSLSREVAQVVPNVKAAVEGLAQPGSAQGPTREQVRDLEGKVDQIVQKIAGLEQSITSLRNGQKDYSIHFDRIQRVIEGKHDKLLTHLPEHVGNGKNT